MKGGRVSFTSCTCLRARMNVNTYKFVKDVRIFFVEWFRFHSVVHALVHWRVVAMLCHGHHIHKCVHVVNAINISASLSLTFLLTYSHRSWLTRLLTIFWIFRCGKYCRGGRGSFDATHLGLYHFNPIIDFVNFRFVVLDLVWRCPCP